MSSDDLQERARKLYAEAQKESDLDKRAEMNAEADWLMEDAEDQTLMGSEREPTEDEIDDFRREPWDEGDEDDWDFDDGVEFEPAPELEDEINGGDLST